MGPSVKFVSAIKDAFFNKKNGGQFFSRKKDQTEGGGAGGGLVKDHTFPEIFFGTLPLSLFSHIGLFRNSCGVLNLPIRYSHTERTGGSFPMALTAMTAKDWKESLDFSTQEVPIKKTKKEVPAGASQFITV